MRSYWSCHSKGHVPVLPWLFGWTTHRYITNYFCLQQVGCKRRKRSVSSLECYCCFTVLLRMGQTSAPLEAAGLHITHITQRPQGKEFLQKISHKRKQPLTGPVVPSQSGDRQGMPLGPNATCSLSLAHSPFPSTQDLSYFATRTQISPTASHLLQP